MGAVALEPGSVCTGRHVSIIATVRGGMSVARLRPAGAGTVAGSCRCRCYGCHSLVVAAQETEVAVVRLN